MIWTNSLVKFENIVDQNIKINKMPGFKGLCQKKNTELMIKLFADYYPEFFQFCPKSYMLPEELEELRRDMEF